MGARRKLDLDRRLEAYFATLRPLSLREVWKRAETWPIYATVGSSAMAMLTGASASIIANSNPETPPDPVRSIRLARGLLASSTNVASIKAVRLAMARNDSADRGLNAPDAVISHMQAPSIARGGVVPLYGSVNTIQPGEWISIYGSRLASGTAVWNSDFPTSLGGTSVQINGKPAYLSYVSPGQINLQAPDDSPVGVVSVVVLTAGGTATSTVTLNEVSPSFSLLDRRHVSGIILRSDGSGAYGGGAYDMIGPAPRCLAYHTVGVLPGDVVELFGFGFGPTTPAVPAGTAFSGAAPINDDFKLYINGILIEPLFVGLSSAGVYQINLIIPPGLGQGDVPIEAFVDGMQTQKNVLLSLGGAATYISCSSGRGMGGGTVGGPVGGSFGGPGGGSGGGFGGSVGGGEPGGGTGGGTGGGSGGGSGGEIRFPHGGKRWAPRLRFPSK